MRIAITPNGYVIVDVRDVQDSELYASYRAAVEPSFQAAGGRYLVRGGDPQTLWGSWRAKRIVVASFPSAAAASAWRGSDAYRPVRQMREKATRSCFLVAEGEECDVPGAPKGFILLDLRDIGDQRLLARFLDAAWATIVAFEGCPLIREGAIRVHEGDWKPQRIFLAAFPTRAHAAAYWANLRELGHAGGLDRAARGSALLLSGPSEAMTGTISNLPLISIDRTKQSRRPTGELLDIPFASIFSDHMVVAEYEAGGWTRAEILPYGPLELLPNISALQYGISVFEGLKAQRTPDGRVALFRPRENAARLNSSARRLAMAEVPEQLFLDALERLVDLDRDWVPPSGAGALYVRPCLFSIDPAIRVKPAERFLFTILTFPFGAYYAAPVDVLVTERFVRTFPGGTGAVKPAGNYAPALAADLEAQAAGCQTVLWLDGIEHRFVEECGVMNVFFVIERDGAPVVVTPPLSGTILPGITRDSVIALLRDGGLALEERPIAIDELLGLLDEGRLFEGFGTGTAATLSHLRSLTYRGERRMMPDVTPDSIGAAVRSRLQEIARGAAEDPFNWLTYVDRKEGS